MKSYQQAPSRNVKKMEMKKRKSPFTPYRVKAKGKETRPGSCQNPSKTACARAGDCEVEKTGGGGQRKISRYRLAGEAAREVIRILGGNWKNDFRTWAFYCYHHDIEDILERARYFASCYRQGEIENPITAFQGWLQEEFPKGGDR